MKIRLHNPSGYCSLEGLEFPIVLEAHHVNEENTAYVKAHLLRAYDVETDDSDFVFFEEEYTVMETEAMPKEDRKGLLLQLVQDYGVAISDGCYESECGTLASMDECDKEAKRLLCEITKMIVEGV